MWDTALSSRVVISLICLTLLACGDQGETTGQASAAIQPNRSIASIEVGMSAAEVRERLGAPDDERPSELHVGWTQWVFGDAGLRVTLDETDTVWDVRTVSSKHRTPSGVGVGSTEEQLRRALSSIECRNAGAGGTGPERNCVDTRGDSSPFTSFRLADGETVSQVVVARGLAQ